MNMDCKKCKSGLFKQSGMHCPYCGDRLFAHHSTLSLDYCDYANDFYCENCGWITIVRR